jgi:glycosyltransferase involved in cell wall biosynthesis
MNHTESWFCAQIGARDHYAVPRALNRKSLLGGLITEAWLPPTLTWLNSPLAQRHHHELSREQILSWTGKALFFEAVSRLRRRTGWKQIMARNAWFQHHAIASLSHHLRSQPATRNPQRIIFAFSYAALHVFEYAKALGWITVLSQIDAGAHEEQIVQRLSADHPALAGPWRPAPAAYWNLWRAECGLADHIVVNSKWSRQALENEGIPSGKLAILPLAFESPNDPASFARQYPASFSNERPLRVLFLGQITLRKGMAAVLDAIDLLGDVPVEFWFVGRMGMNVPDRYLNLPNVRWPGPVPKSGKERYYREADVFLFPTMSDGFGLTQLEAQAWKLPVVASPFCGDVVRHRENGWLLPEVTLGTVAAAIRHCLDNPRELEQWAGHSKVAPEFSLESIGSKLVNLVNHG